MKVFQQLLFLIALGTAALLLYRRASMIYKAIRLGKAEDLSDRPSERFGTMLRVAFAQKKMFDRPFAATLHLLVYIGFVLINIELLEIVLDGLLGAHRLFAASLGGFYPVLISFYELLALGVIVGCTIFLFRRAPGGVDRLQAQRHRELKGWPALDARVILSLEIVLMLALFTMNASDLVLQSRGEAHYAATGDFLVSSFIKPLFEGLSTTTLVVVERIAWWLHILGIFCFAVYVTYSKHLHILLAFPNTYFSRLTPKGQMKNMPEITKEVRLMLGLEQATPHEPPAEMNRFGAKDVNDLSWKNLLDSYSCTECGRCTSACPANQTGKLLSPRKIMMDTRDRLEEVARSMHESGGVFREDGKSLLGDYITQEELLACTTCNACVEECPILINPLDIILQLRRYKVMDEAQAPASWNMMFQNMETNQAPWKFSPADRFNWADTVSATFPDHPKE
ncbi:(Fe-S)-binding protein [Ravibacter arvi]|uniref:(Fe-S)-binding protein n=1 Tax=Ravibacter arvi TaxID=2051041 RepID=A0ABP8M5F1_9BACT